MNSCLIVDDMFVHVDWLIKCCWYWIHVSKNHMYEYVVFLWKMMNNEVVVWWTWNEFMDNCVDDVWKHVVDELVWWICHCWIDDESCCCCEIIMKVLVNFWIETKLCLIHKFWAFFSMCLCTWPINFIWDEFWVWEDQNWSVWEKGFWNSKFFFWTVERLLKQTLSEPQASMPRCFWTQFAWASCERSSKQTKMFLLDRVRLSELQANTPRMLLRPGRLSEPDFA